MYTKPICSKIDINKPENEIAKDFINCIDELLKNSEVKKLDEYSQHLNTSRLQHSINVSYYSYLFCKYLKFDYKSAARAGLLHDLYLYNRHIQKFEQSHTIYHPKEALKNAKKMTILNPIEEDAILKHMWPLCKGVPRYKESVIVTIADKYCATAEILKQINHLIKSEKIINTSIKKVLKKFKLNNYKKAN